MSSTSRIKWTQISYLKRQQIITKRNRIILPVLISRIWYLGLSRLKIYCDKLGPLQRLSHHKARQETWVNTPPRAKFEPLSSESSGPMTVGSLNRVVTRTGKAIICIYKIILSC